MPAFRARYNYSIESISWAKIYLAEVVEKVLVDLLQVKNFLVTAADIVAEHEAGELRAVNQHDPATKSACGVSRGR